MAWPLHFVFSAVLLTGFASTAAAERYNLASHTTYKILGQGEETHFVESDQLATISIDTSLFDKDVSLRLYTGLLSVGPITEAYMTSWAHPVPNEVPLMPFLQKLSTLQAVHLKLSGVQTRRAVDGDWAVVVRSSGYRAALFTGHTTACEGNGGAKQCQVELSRSADGVATDAPNGEWEMFSSLFTPSMRIDRATGRLCLRIKFNWNNHERPLVSVQFSETATVAASRAVIGQLDPSHEFVDACAPAAQTLVEAFEAGHLQVTVATGAAPGAEYVSRFVVVNTSPGRPLIGRHPFSPLPDLH